MKLFDVPEGGYRSLPNGPPYSQGVIAVSGHRIDQVVLTHPVPVDRGFAVIDRYLADRDRPVAALCGIELRSPIPGSFQAFGAFNATYQALLEERGLIVDGTNPIARTNVVPSAELPEACLVGFSYATPTEQAERTFVVAGAAELRGGALQAAAIVRPGEDTPAAIVDKAAHVVATMLARLQGLQASAEEVTTVRVYTTVAVPPAVDGRILEAFPATRIRGVVRHHADPPVDGLVFEMDVRREGVVRPLDPLPFIR